MSQHDDQPVVVRTSAVDGQLTSYGDPEFSRFLRRAFLNSAGLARAGQNNFAATSASGSANIGKAGTGGRGTVTTGELEMSNVDLATEFTGMITAERGFQANSRVITTSDEMLQELVNLKR